jgi:hypothetical protein
VSDGNLFAIGCGVVFLFFAGVYVFARERFLDGSLRDPEPVAAPVASQAHSGPEAGRRP